MQQNTACPACGRETPVTSAAFCPYCGAPLDQSAPMDGAAQAALDKALKESDPVKKHRLLLQAREQHPDCLPIEEELLHLGRLYERSASTLDYSVIKCYLLQLYLAPEELSGDKRDAMRRELFCDPQLLACQRLAPDAEAFTRQYLERLSTEFIRIFLRGSNRSAWKAARPNCWRSRRRTCLRACAAIRSLPPISAICCTPRSTPPLPAL